MIEAAPEDRFASADELLDALDGASNLVVYPQEQVVPHTTKRPALTVAAVGVGGLLLLLLVFVFLLAA